MSEDLPKQELLIKLLKMTTSSNDGEATIAIRKANDLLKSAGWDWEKLIHGKIKVIEDPFKSVKDPALDRKHNDFDNAYSRPKAPPRPPQAPNFSPPPPPSRPAPKPARPVINSTKSNIYAGWCYCCGDAVLQNEGFIFDPNQFNASARSKWMIACKSCNSSAYVNIRPSAAPRTRPLGNATPSLNDI